MTTKVTVKGQVTLLKAVRDAAGIKPGDSVSVRARPADGVIVELELQGAKDAAAVEKARRRIDRAVDDLYRRGNQAQYVCRRIDALDPGRRLTLVDSNILIVEQAMAALGVGHVAMRRN